jgi:hypothetical protein
MPTLASIVLVAVLLIAFGTPRFSHADPTVLNICINPGGAIRAVDPSEACPRNHTRVSVPPRRASTTGLLHSRATRGNLRPAHNRERQRELRRGRSGGQRWLLPHQDQPDLQVSGSAPEGERSWIVQVQNFSATLSYQLILFARCARLSP